MKNLSDFALSFNALLGFIRIGSLSNSAGDCYWKFLQTIPPGFGPFCGGATSHSWLIIMPSPHGLGFHTFGSYGQLWLYILPLPIYFILFYFLEYAIYFQCSEHPFSFPYIFRVKFSHIYSSSNEIHWPWLSTLIDVISMFIISLIFPPFWMRFFLVSPAIFVIVISSSSFSLFLMRLFFQAACSLQVYDLCFSCVI